MSTEKAKKQSRELSAGCWPGIHGKAMLFLPHNKQLHRTPTAAKVPVNDYDGVSKTKAIP